MHFGSASVGPPMPTGSRQIALPVGSDRQVQSLQGNAAVSKIDKSRPGRRVGSPHLPKRRHQPKNQRMITECPGHGMEGSWQQHVVCMMFFPIAVQGSAPLKGTAEVKGNPQSCQQRPVKSTGCLSPKARERHVSSTKIMPERLAVNQTINT